MYLIYDTRLFFSFSLGVTQEQMLIKVKIQRSKFWVKSEIIYSSRKIIQPEIASLVQSTYFLTKVLQC